MISAVFKVAGGAVLLLIFVAVGLDGIKGTPSLELQAQRVSQQKDLENKADEFAKCDHTLKSESLPLGTVNLSYLHFGINDNERQRVNSVKAKFLEKIISRCKPITKAYTKSYAHYKKIVLEIADIESSLLDKLINRKIKVPERVYSEYEPSYVSMMQSPLTDQIYTIDDVRSFYKTELGY